MSHSSIDCWVCGAPADRWKLPESRLCGRCMSDPVDALRDAGFEVSTSGSGTQRELVLKAPPHRAPMIQIAFGPEGVADLFKKLLKPELKVGRKEVDDLVYFDYADPAYLPLLRGYEVTELMVEICETSSVVVDNDTTKIAVFDANADIGATALVVASFVDALRRRQDEMRAEAAASD